MFALPPFSHEMKHITKWVYIKYNYHQFYLNIPDKLIIAPVKYPNVNDLMPNLQEFF